MRSVCSVVWNASSTVPEWLWEGGEPLKVQDAMLDHISALRRSRDLAVMQCELIAETFPGMRLVMDDLAELIRVP